MFRDRVSIRSPASHQFCQSKVQDFHLPACRHKNVGGLDVAVHYACAVGGVERVSDLNSEVQHLFYLEPVVLNEVLEGLPRQQLHRNVMEAFIFPNVVNCADVRVVESRRRTSFALKTLNCHSVARYLGGKELERDLPSQTRVLGLVHHAHAAATELFQYPVMRNGSANNSVHRLAS